MRGVGGYQFEWIALHLGSFSVFCYVLGQVAASALC